MPEHKKIIKKGVLIDALPQYSPWPSRLLGLEAFSIKQKNAQSVSREYEDEKWAPLLKRIRSHQAKTIADVDQIFFSQHKGPLASLYHGDLVEWSLPAYHERYIKIVHKTIKNLLPASGVAELGCGYGSLILNLAMKKPFRKMPLWAGEYAPSGVEIVSTLSKNLGAHIHADRCDFCSPHVTDMPIKPGAVIFTSFAVACVPRISEQFVEALMRFQPKAVVHFEPNYEDADPKSLLGLMKQRYIQLNDYNTNLWPVLKRFSKAGKIKIIQSEKDVIGSNPFLPASLIIWKPNGK